MLSNKKLNIFADTEIDGEKIASFTAILNIEKMDLTLAHRYINKDACKEHRDVVRADMKEFEDYAYGIQDSIAALHA